MNGCMVLVKHERATGAWRRNSAAVVLSLVCGSGLMSAPPALAQLSPLPGGTVVTITSPPSGSRVSGAVALNASVSATGPFGITGVQFKLDGTDLGVEDTAAPYTVPWNSAAATDGWHTLTAVARDASGVQYSSNPVTIRVSNTVPPPAAVQRYEETDALVSYSAGWGEVGAGVPLRAGWFQEDESGGWLAYSGGSAAVSVTPGAQVTVTFTGTSVSWIGYRGVDAGIARVLVDGVLVAEVDLFARADEVRAPVYTVTGLTHSTHTMTIEVTGRKNEQATLNVVVVDAFDVPAPVVSRLQETDPSMTYSAGWARSPTMEWSGWFANVSTTPGARATLTFNGTAVSWNGYRGPDTGIARVYLDGSFAGEIDTYSATRRVQDVLFTATGLAEASHTLTIEVTGLNNQASTGTVVLLDGFDVTTPGTRFQETDWSVAYTGSWTANRNRPWSEGTSSVSGTPGAQATFTFTGTSVTWIGARAERTGIANVYLDGVFVTEVDTYAPQEGFVLTEGFQNAVFTATGLAEGSHTLTIEVTGRKNPAATNSYVIVDAFDVRP
jgi:hypothetical protein